MSIKQAGLYSQLCLSFNLNIEKAENMSKINQQDVERLLELVGGSENIASVTHCITRLRFALNDPAKAHPKQIEDLRMVKGCFTNAGQFQVVIGPEVDDYYQALIAISGKKVPAKAETKAAARQNMNLFERVISHIAEIFFPLLPALISGGLILGFRNLIGDIPFDHGQSLANIYPLWKTVYDFLWLLGEAIFMFLPVAVCWSTVKLGGTEILGIVLGITLVSPQLMNAYQLGSKRLKCGILAGLPSRKWVIRHRLFRRCWSE